MRYTTNYNFDLYDPDDNANLCDGYNHTVEKLDSLLYQLNSMLTSANNAIGTLQTRVGSLETRVSALESKA